MQRERKRIRPQSDLKLAYSIGHEWKPKTNKAGQSGLGFRQKSKREHSTHRVLLVKDTVSKATSKLYSLNVQALDS